MDLFDFSSIIEFVKVGPGHNLLQSFLLFMIWISSRGIKKEVVLLRDTIDAQKKIDDHKFEQVEDRLVVLEQKKTGGY